jgi:hypothetical protein
MLLFEIGYVVIAFCNLLYKTNSTHDAKYDESPIAPHLMIVIVQHNVCQIRPMQERDMPYLNIKIFEINNYVCVSTEAEAELGVPLLGFVS